MNKNQRFDEHLKEQFSDYAPEVNPRIWENIIAQREKKRPAGFWFTLLNSRNIFILLGILLAGGTGAWLLGNNWPFDQNSNDNQNQEITQKITVPVTTNNDAVTVNSTNTDQQLPDQGITGKNDNTANTPSSYSTQFNKPADASFTITSPDTYNNQFPADYRNNNKKQTNRKQTSWISPVVNGVENDEDNESGYNKLSPQSSFMSRLLFGIPGRTAQQRSILNLQTRSFPNIILPGCPSIEKDAAGNKRYIEVYGGPDYGFLSLKDTGNNSAYLQKRKESTSFSSAYSAGLRYTRVFNNGMSVRAGLNYSQINEKFTLVQGNLVQITYIIDANGDTTGSYITTGTRYRTTYNKYRSLDIPLLLGYELGNGKLHANINAGAVINIYSWQKGEVMDTANQPVSITTGKTSSPYGFKTNAGVGFMGAVSVYYKLNEKLHILAEPYFRYNFSPMNKDRITLKQKYNTAGIRVGIRVDLP